MFARACKPDGMQLSNHYGRRRTLRDANFCDDDYIIFSFGEDGCRILPLEPVTIEKSTPTRRLLQKKQSCTEDALDYGRDSKASSWRSDPGILAESADDMHGSVGSKRSDKSNCSFAFPIINWERLGSPAKMGISLSGLQHSKKKKLKSLPFCCCEV